MSETIEILFADGTSCAVAQHRLAGRSGTDPEGSRDRPCVVIVPAGPDAAARIAALKARLPRSRILVTLRVVDRAALEAMLEAGADAVAADTLDAAALKAAVESLAGPEQDRMGDAPAGDTLTPREAEVLRLLSAGFSNKEVARRLDVSVRTVETHRLNLRRKTQTGRLRDLVQLARRLGLSPVDDAPAPEDRRFTGSGPSAGSPYRLEGRRFG